MESRFFALGLWIAKHRLAVILSWLAIVVVAALGAGRLESRLHEGSSEVPGSNSARMDRVLSEEFKNPFTQLLVVTVSSTRYSVDDPTYQTWIKEIEKRARTLSAVQRVASYLTIKDARFRSPDGHQTVVMLGLKTKSLHEEQKVVPLLRAALQPIRDAIRAADPQGDIATVGRSAIIYDIDNKMKTDGQKGEAQALPLTLVILLFAFGAPVAAGIPIIVALAGVLITLGLGFVLSQFAPLSAFLVNIVTMVGLALGIDYSLLMVNRFRTALRGGHAIRGAVAEALAKAGPAIVFSGLAVMISLTALLIAPMIEFRSMGIGGSQVVLVCVVAALTLVPALLAYLGPWIDAPRWLSQRCTGANTEKTWRGIASWVMERPIRVLVGATAFVLLLAAPARWLDLGFSNSRWFPASMEVRRGFENLEPMGQYNSVLPIYAVLRAPPGKPILQARYLPDLVHFTRELKKNPKVGEVLSPVSLRQDLGLLQYLLLYRNLDRALKKFPEIDELFLSKDRSAALFQIIPTNDAKLREIQALATYIENISVGSQLILEIGGEPVYYNDFNKQMRDISPWIIAYVIIVTLIILFIAFKSYLLPIKAVIMNILSVAAGYGVIVAVFQFGWGLSLFGMQEPMGAIPISLPLFIFCLTFGLSMDYEVFLLTRIKEVYDQTGDNRQATAEGLASTGGIITSAAAIMVVVFGANAFVEMPLSKIVGLGLAVTVLVDATIVRVLLVPAFMRIADRWNWLPGRRAASPFKTALPKSRRIR